MIGNEDFAKKLHHLCLVQNKPPEVLCKKGVLKNFAKFTDNCARVSYFNNFIKNEALAQVFS